MKLYKKFDFSVLYSYFLNVAGNIQQNFSTYFYVFFFNHSINFYVLLSIQQFTSLFFLTLQMAFISFLISCLICDSVGKYRKLAASAIIELVVLINVLYFIKDNEFLMGYISVITFCSLGIILVFMPSKYLKLVTLLILGIIWGIDLFSLVYYKTPMNSTMITFMLETNYWEIYEYAVTFVMGPMIFGVIGSLFLLLFFYLKIKLNVSSQNAIAKILLLFLPVGAVVTFYPCVKVDYTNNYRENIPAVRFILSTTMAMERRNAYESFAVQEGNEKLVVENNSKIKNIVVVLGESASKNHMSIYGYPLNTTPKTESLLKSGHLKRFKDVISSYETTTLSMSKLFTFSNYEFDQDDTYLHENLIDVMKQAGYKTYWLSNQEFSSLFGNIEMHLSKRSDQKSFTRYRGSEQMNLSAYDEELLPLVDQSIADAVDKKFIVVHLMGSHNAFRYRYPEEYNKFNASDILLNENPNPPAMLGRIE